MKELIDAIASQYDENDSTFAEKALAKINMYFDALAPSRSEIDPDRLGTKMQTISRLRTAILNQLEPLRLTPAFMKKVDDAIETAIFNESELKEQIKFQAKSKQKGLNKWVHDLEIVPKNLKGLQLASDEFQRLSKLREASHREKINSEEVKIPGDRIQMKLFPALYKPNAKWFEIASGLLLATGRRSVEIMKTAVFEPVEGDKFAAMFSGQAKAALEAEDRYEIPLLQPFDVVQKALARLRELVDTTQLDNTSVNSNYSPSISAYTKRETDVTPHELRAIYALMTRELMEKPATIIGHISRVLGHSKTGSSTHYQHIKIVDLTGRYSKEQKVTDFVAHTGPERKRVMAIKQLIREGKAITIKALGGANPVLQRVLANNKELIDAHNATVN